MASEPSLPSFEDGKFYFIKGASGRALVEKLKRDEPRVVEGGGLEVTEQTPDGTFLSMDEGDANHVPDPPSSGNYVLTAQGGVLSWEAIEDC